MKITHPIGVFDSGLGGLNILKELRRVLPHEDYAYLADNRNSPYGIKSEAEIIGLVRKVIKFFEKISVKLIVLACNTSSAFLDKLRLETNIPLLGVIEPTVAETVKSGRDYAVLATNATIDSGVYQKLLAEKSRLKKRKMHFLKCSEFVSAIENGLINCAKSRELVSEKLKVLSENKPDTIVLGCTHFDLYKEEIREIYPEAKIISSGPATARAVKNFLKKHNLDNPQTEHGKLSIYITGEFDNFRNRSDFILHRLNYEKIDLNNC